MASKSRFPLSPLKRPSRRESLAFAGLESVAGIRSVLCPSLPDLVCPFCASTDVAVLMGKMSFTATIEGHDLFDGKPQPFVMVLCSSSHFFLIREEDLLGTKSVAA
jgi:hypothetical protein